VSEQVRDVTPLRRLSARLLGDERVRFILVGGINTVFGYGVFALLDIFAGRTIGYLGSLYGSYIIATILAFTLHRRFTFRASGTGNIVVDFVRFQGVYLVSLAINTAALALLIGVLHWPALIAQALIVIVTTVVSFFGHKYFSFRRRAHAGPAETRVGDDN
jgi:putative flippase GtrA